MPQSITVDPSQVQAATPDPSQSQPVTVDPSEVQPAPADFSTTVYAPAGGFWGSLYSHPKDKGLLETIGGEAKDFLGQLGSDIYNFPKATMEQISGHPLDEATKLGTGLTEGRHQSWQQMKDAYAKGNYKEAFEHLVGAFPILGPPLNQAMNETRMPAAGQAPDETHQGKTGVGLVHAAESLFPFAAPALEEAAATETGQRAIQAVQSRIPQKVGIPPLVRNQLNPMEQANQEWLTQHPTEPPIQTPVSMQTGSRTAANLEGSVRQSLGGGYAETARQQTREAVLGRARAELEKIAPESSPEEAGSAVSQKLAADLENTRANLANEVSPNPSTPEQAGQKVIDAGKKQIQQFDKQADQAYKAAYQALADPRNIEDVPVRDKDGGLVHDEDGNVVTQKMALPVDMTDLQHALLPIADRYAYTMSETDARASLGLSTMRRIIAGLPKKPLDAAELDRGLLLDAARNENLPELRDISQGMAAQSVRGLTQAIDSKMSTAAYPGWDPASGTPSPALTNLRAGRLATAQKYDVADTFAGLGRRNINELEPVGVHQRLTWAGDAGINQLRDIAKVAPDAMPDVGRAFIDSGGNWSKLGPETKKIIFGGDDNLISNLDEHYTKERRFGKLTQMEPVQLFDKLTAARGRMVNLLRSVAEETPEQIPQIARAWTQGLLDTITQKGDIHHADSVWNSWFKMDPQKKKILFPNPGQVDDLNNTFFALQRLNREVNPSGSGYIVALNAMKRDILRGAGGLVGGGAGLAGGATGAVEGAGLGLVVGGVMEPIANATLARLLYDPRFTRLLTKGIQLQLRGDAPKAALAARTLAQVASEERMPGEGRLPPEEPPEGPPAGGGGGGGAPPAAPPAAGGGGTGLKEMGGGMAGGITDSMYSMLWDKVQKGDTTEAGGPSPLLQAAQLIRHRGGMRSVEDLKALAQDYAIIPHGGQYFQQDMRDLIEMHSPPTGGVPPGPTQPPAGGNIAESLQGQADAAIQRMRDRGTFSGTQSNALFPAEDLADMAIWGAAKMAKGVTQLGAWSKEMLADAGSSADRVRPQLPKLYIVAQKTLERHIANTAGDLPNTQKMLAMYRKGIEGQDWYRNTKAELQSVFGPDTDKFVDFLAATSPNTTVAANTSLALKAYMQWKTGKPFTGYLPETIKSLNKAAAGEEFGGLKVQSFRKNLHGDPVPVTVDRWIARALGFGDQPTVPQYKFMDYLVSQVAAKKGLEPRQLQAAIWKTIKDTEGLAGQGGESYEVLVRRKLLSDPDLAAAIQQAAPQR